MKLRSTWKLAVLLAVTVTTSNATSGKDWVEVGDAPDGVPANQATYGTGPLLTISGETNDLLGDFADTYSIVITDPAAFYATTSATFSGGPGTASFDTRLFLWTENGDLVLGNDDWPLVEDPFHSLITDPAFFPGTVDPSAGSVSLTPGTYLLTITGYDANPFDASGTSLADFPLDFAALYGINPLSNGVFNNWDFTSVNGVTTGSYTIELGGASFSAIPEPSSALVLGMLAMGAAGIRRRRAA